MINTDEEALICDFAETYHIYNYRSLPLHMAGIYACGLRQDARIIMAMSKTKLTADQTMLAMISDNTRMLAWLNSADGMRGVNRPKSLVEILLGNVKQNVTSGIEAFETGQDFDDEWRRLTGGDE